MSKRANGEGSIYKDTNKGVWVAAVSINGQRMKRSAPTQREAKALRDELMKNAAIHAPKDKTFRTVQDLLDAWFESQTASETKAASTLDTTRWALEHISRQLGSVLLSKLSFEDIERAFKAMANSKHKLSRSSLRKIRSVLNQACTWGERRKALSTNPVSIAELPKTKPTQPKRSLSHVEVEMFLTTIDGSRLEALWSILFSLGLRSGEVRALLWKDWDRKTKKIAVRRNIRTVDGVPTVVYNMKTPASKRTLNLPEAITDLLQKHFELAELEGRSNPDDLIFGTSSGRPIDAANLRRDLHELCDVAGIPRITVHELRHTCASVLADGGTPAEKLADLLGHRDIRTTHNTYRHALSASVDAHLETMDTIFRKRRK